MPARTYAVDAVSAGLLPALRLEGRRSAATLAGSRYRRHRHRNVAKCCSPTRPRARWHALRAPRDEVFGLVRAGVWVFEVQARGAAGDGLGGAPAAGGSPSSSIRFMSSRTLVFVPRSRSCSGLAIIARASAPRPRGRLIRVVLAAPWRCSQDVAARGVRPVRLAPSAAAAPPAAPPSATATATASVAARAPGGAAAPAPVVPIVRGSL